MRLSTPSGPFHGRALPFHATRQVDEFSICLNKVPAGLIVWTGPWHLGWLCFSPRHDESMARKTGTVTSESELWTTPMRFHPFHPFPFFLFFFTVYKYVKYVLFSLCFPPFPVFPRLWKFMEILYGSASTGVGTPWLSHLGGQSCCLGGWAAVDICW